MEKRYLMSMIFILVIAALACNAPFSGDDETEPAEDTAIQSDTSAADTTTSEIPGSGDESTDQEQSADDMAAEEEQASEPASEADQPASPSMTRSIGIRQGLASLDTFRVVMNTINNGPTELDIEESYVEIRNNNSDKTQHMRTENVSSSAEYPEEERSIEDQYQIDLITCTLSTYEGETSADVQEMSPLERDMLSSSSNLFDVIITAENATFEGEETVNGIPTGHYSFKITGLGDYSGEEVTQADGSYWLATDGGYLVKYNIVLEIRTAPKGDPEAEVAHAEYTYDLLDVNQPMTIALPAECGG